MSNAKFRSGGVPDPVTGSLAESGQSASFAGNVGRNVSITLWGTWAGTVQVQRSYDDGAIWHNMTRGGAALNSFTGACDEEADIVTTPGVLHRIDFTRTSGTLNYRLGH